VIDSREQHQTTCDPMRINSEFVANEIDESDSQDEKHNEQRIVTDVIRMFANARGPI
jgi:hypothetical protein